MTFVPRMIRAATRGYVVNTASMVCFLAAGVCGIYNTTKFAVRGLSASLRASLAPHGIGVSVLCPGLVKSYIYASDEIRPERLKAGARPVNTEAVKRLAEVHQFGMEPDVIAARVLDAMREDRFHIFSHPEFRDELSEVFAETLQDFRDYPPDPGHGQRIDYEKIRRESYRKQRRGLKEG
jgi:short-subunit dehydrogenase